jgi:hypothetical protein
MAPPYELTFAIRVLALTASGWTDLVGLANLPIGCNQIVIYNNNSVPILLRTDPNNANSQITLNDGEAFDIGVAMPRIGSGGFRFDVNCPPVCSLQSSAGNLNVIIESYQ